MVEPRFKSPQPASYIPVMSPRRSESTSAIPSSINVPNLSLVHPNRRPPGSAGGPSQSFQSTPPTTSTSSNNGFSSLRNLRNFLPFGSTKAQVSSVNAHGYGAISGGSGSTSKKPLGALGAVRRSMAVDRKRSWTTSTSGDGSQSGDQDEVMVIEAGVLRRSTSEGSQVGLFTRRSLSPPVPPPKDVGTSSLTFIGVVLCCLRASSLF